MLVTLPFVLLLLDYWPLRRLDRPPPNSRRAVIWGLIREKIPFLGLSAASCVVTLFAQRATIAPIQLLPLSNRVGNALAAYVTYLKQMFFPANLAVLYPHPASASPRWESGLALMILAGITAVVLGLSRQRRHLLTGWLWYVGMMLPVIGLVQVGFQSRADRYTYLPQIGLYLMAAWTVRDLTASWRYRVLILWTAGIVIIAALMACAWKQTTYWRTNEALWRRTLACTSPNPMAEANFNTALGQKLALQGRYQEAVPLYRRALEIAPDFAGAAYFAEAHYNLGTLYFKLNQADKAGEELQQAIDLDPGLAEAHYNWALLLAARGRLGEAIEQYQKAIIASPDFIEARYDLGVAFGLRGQVEDAIEQYRKAIEINPDYADAHGNLANLLLAQGRLDEAVQEYQRTLKLVPNSAQAHFRFGQALQKQKKYAAAMAEYQKTLELDPRHLPVQLALAWLLATCPDAALRDGHRAVELVRQIQRLSPTESPQLLDILAAAYAESGQFPQAIATARQALNLNATKNDRPLTDAIQSRLMLYEANAPYHEKP